MANLQGDSTGIWTTVHSDMAELTRLTAQLDAWSAQLDPRGVGCPAYIWSSPTSLDVLTGALVANMPRAQLDNCGFPSGEMRLAVRANAERLKAEGFLRDYQAEAVSAGLEATMGRCVLDVFMGGGKTRIAAGLAAAAGGRWLYLVQNKELARQSEQSFTELLAPMAQVCIDVERPQICATTYAGVKKLDDRLFDGVIVDECHCISAPTRALAYAAVRAPWRIGLSGTPLDRTDNRNALVVGFLGPIAYTIGLEQLAKEGHLSSGSVRVLKFIPGYGVQLV